MELNAQQVAGWLRVALSAGGPIAALAMSKMGVSEKDWALYTEVALAIVPGLVVAIWSWYRNRKATQVELVASMPAEDQRAALNKVSDAAKIQIAKETKGVQVHVDTTEAAPAVVAMAKDPNVSDVVPMIGGPREDANKSTN